MVKGLLSTVNVAEEKQRFVPQTSCLQQQGLILALRVNTSVTPDPLFTQKDRRARTPPPTPPIVGSVPSSRFLYRSKLSKLCLKVNEG